MEPRQVSHLPAPEWEPEPPTRHASPSQWVRSELFPNWWNGLLTLLVAPLVLWAGYHALRFVFVTGRWEIVEANLTNLMVGRFPRDAFERLWIAGAILAVAIGAGTGVVGAAAREAAIAAGRDPDIAWHLRLRRAGPPLMLLVVLAAFVRTPTPIVLLLAVTGLGVAANRLGARVPARHRRWLNLGVVVGIVVALYAITGFGGVPRGAWGGFLLTAYYTIAALLLAFPIGIVLALGRRSSLPVVRAGCSVYIEFFRGSPLIALLFIGWLVLPFFFTLFTSAYVAEIVRSGLQAVPRGQVEAAQALGLSPWKQTRRVVLPQALRAVIPALVGQAISLFKDTTLVLIIGQLDLLAVAQNITQQEAFRGQGYIAESLIFVSLIYWVASYWMSRESQRLEARLGVGTR
jgi:general L-amino acid transport system permease protein